MKNEYLVKLVNEHPLAILPAKLEQIEGFLRYRVDGGPPVRYEPATPGRGGYTMVGSTAVIPVFGVLSKRIGMMDEISGGTSVDVMMGRFRSALADTAVRTIVLQFDSPGGSVYGIQEAAEEIFAARSRKRIVAHADPLAASAAYWLATAASELVVTPSGEVGSVGVVAMHVDYSSALDEAGIKVSYIHAGEHKVEGNPHQPLSAEAGDFIQQRVNEYYDVFVGAVAKHRGISRSAGANKFGQGRVYGSNQALAAGMVDRVASLNDLLTTLHARSASHALGASIATGGGVPSPNRSLKVAQAESDIASAVLLASAQGVQL